MRILSLVLIISNLAGALPTSAQSGREMLNLLFQVGLVGEIEFVCGIPISAAQINHLATLGALSVRQGITDEVVAYEEQRGADYFWEFEAEFGGAAACFRLPQLVEETISNRQVFR